VKRTGSLKYSVIVWVGALVLGLSSCKTTRVVTTTSTAKPISTNKLIRNIENNAFDYKHLAIKKINCQFDNGKTKTSFKESFRSSLPDIGNIFDFTDSSYLNFIL